MTLVRVRARRFGFKARVGVSSVRGSCPARQNYPPLQQVVVDVRRLELEKTPLDRGRTDRISLIYDLDLHLQSSASRGHDLLACKSSS